MHRAVGMNSLYHTQSCIGIFFANVRAHPRRDNLTAPCHSLAECRMCSLSPLLENIWDLRWRNGHAVHCANHNILHLPTPLFQNPPQASSKTAPYPRHPKISPPDDPHGKSRSRIPASMHSPSKKPRRNFKICQYAGLTLFRNFAFR